MSGVSFTRREIFGTDGPQNPVTMSTFPTGTTCRLTRLSCTPTPPLSGGLSSYSTGLNVSAGGSFVVPSDIYVRAVGVTSGLRGPPTSVSYYTSSNYTGCSQGPVALLCSWSFLRSLVPVLPFPDVISTVKTPMAVLLRRSDLRSLLVRLVVRVVLRFWYRRKGTVSCRGRYNADTK